MYIERETGCVYVSDISVLFDRVSEKLLGFKELGWFWISLGI